MKKYHFWSIALIFVWLFGCKKAPSYEVNTTQGEEQVSYFHPKEGQVLISAHRGGSGLVGYPENALESMQYLLKNGINLYEIDIMETEDGELMLLHDNHLERTTTGTGSVDGKTTEALRKFDLVDDFGTPTKYKIPYLKEVLTWGKENNGYFMLDFKKGVSYQKVIEMVRQLQMENNVCLISYNTKQAKKLNKLAPEMMISVSARNEVEKDEILKSGIPTEKMMAFTGTKLSSEKLYQELREKKIPVNLGTLGNLDKKAAAKGDDLYTKWKAMGVNVFSTDRPIQVLKAIK